MFSTRLRKRLNRFPRQMAQSHRESRPSAMYSLRAFYENNKYGNIENNVFPLWKGLRGRDFHFVWVNSSTSLHARWCKRTAYVHQSRLYNHDQPTGSKEEILRKYSLSPLIFLFNDAFWHFLVLCANGSTDFHARLRKVTRGSEVERDVANACFESVICENSCFKHRKKKFSPLTWTRCFPLVWENGSTDFHARWLKITAKAGQAQCSSCVHCIGHLWEQ